MVLGILFDFHIETQDFEPRMHVADSDFRELTKNKALDENGDIGPQAFEQIIREQIRLYTQARHFSRPLCCLNQSQTKFRFNKTIIIVLLHEKS
jgi:hypothetical protein